MNKKGSNDKRLKSIYLVGATMLFFQTGALAFMGNIGLPTFLVSNLISIGLIPQVYRLYKNYKIKNDPKFRVNHILDKAQDSLQKYQSHIRAKAFYLQKRSLRENTNLRRDEVYIRESIVKSYIDFKETGKEYNKSLDFLNELSEDEINSIKQYGRSISAKADFNPVLTNEFVGEMMLHSYNKNNNLYSSYNANGTKISELNKVLLKALVYNKDKKAAIISEKLNALKKENKEIQKKVIMPIVSDKSKAKKIMSTFVEKSKTEHFVPTLYLNDEEMKDLMKNETVKKADKTL